MGSVRALTYPSGAVTDTYDYDAFGNLLHSTGTTAGGVTVYEVLNPVEILGLAALAIRLTVPLFQTDLAAATLEEAF